MPKREPKNGPVVGWCEVCHRKVREAFVSPEGSHTASVSRGARNVRGMVFYKGPCYGRVLKIGKEALACDGGCGHIAKRGDWNPVLNTPTGWRCMSCRPEDDRPA